MVKKRENKFVLSNMKKKNSVLFFDMDGTLIETDRANYLSYRQAVMDVTKKEIPFVTALRMNRDMLYFLLPDITVDAYQEILERKEQYYDTYLSLTKKNEGLVKVLMKCSGGEQLLVLVTKSKKRRAMKTLEYHDLIDRFDAMFFKDAPHVGHESNKYRKAIKSLSVAPESVIVFENEEKEISDAKKCGIPIINPKINGI